MIAAIALFVSQTGVLNPPTLYVRNESQTGVNLLVQGNPGSHSVSVVLRVPAWTDGTCATGRWSMGTGNRPVQASLDGGSQPAITFPPNGPYYVRVDASGVLHVGEPVPTDPVGCTVYPVTLR